MQAILKREEIDYIYELYREEENDELRKIEHDLDTQKHDSAQTKVIFKTGYLT